MSVKLGSMSGVQALCALIGFEIFLFVVLYLYFNTSLFSLIPSLIWSTIVILAAVKNHLTVLKVVKWITIFQIIASVLATIFFPLIMCFVVASGAYFEILKDPEYTDSQKLHLRFVDPDEKPEHHMRTGIIIGVAIFIVFLLATIVKFYILKLVKAFIREHPENQAGRSKA